MCNKLCNPYAEVKKQKNKLKYLYFVTILKHQFGIPYLRIVEIEYLQYLSSLFIYIYFLHLYFNLSTKYLLQTSKASSFLIHPLTECQTSAKRTRLSIHYRSQCRKITLKNHTFVICSELLLLLSVIKVIVICVHLNMDNPLDHSDELVPGSTLVKCFNVLENAKTGKN